MRSLPGEVANPKGHNQYTYKQRFENSVDRLLNGDIDERYLEVIPEVARPFLQDIPDDWEVGDVLAIVTLVKALSGDEKALSEALKRIWPSNEKLQVEDNRPTVIIRDYSGGRNGRSPHEIGPVTIEAHPTGTYSAAAAPAPASAEVPGKHEDSKVR
jgi:hypothetical protein